MNIFWYEFVMKMYGIVNRHVFPKRQNVLLGNKPASTRFGYDRGTPIDRYWIELFLNQNRKCIRGTCLEIGDRRYTKKFGTSVVKSHVLDIDRQNEHADIIADLRNLEKEISDKTYDCIIVTQVFGMIDDLSSAIEECYRILKPGGILLATLSSISPTYDLDHSYWRFTTTSTKYLFEPVFGKNNVSVSGFGNFLAGQGFWIGLAKEELTLQELNTYDPKYQCLVTLKATRI